MGGGADPSRPAAEVPGGGAEKAGTGAGRAGDPHPGEGAEHHHPPAVPREAARGTTAGQVPAQSPQTEGREPDQPAIRYWILSLVSSRATIIKLFEDFSLSLTFHLICLL